MILSSDELAAIAGQAAAEYPNECCGVVLERRGERRVVACRNVQDARHAEDPERFPRTARNAYFMDPRDILAWSRLESDGFRVAVIYHSHPDAGAYFSETDKEQAAPSGEAAYPEAIYVVVSVVGGQPRAAAAYRFDPEHRVFVRADAGELALNEGSGGSESRRWLAAAERVMPGGVNSPVRAFRAVGGEPFVVVRAEGSRLWDADGRAYIDYVGSWGPLVLGHAAKPIVTAVTTAAEHGTSYGAPTRGEVALADAISRAMPSIETVRLVSSGTEATMSAIRLARGATGRDLLVKFDGCYHGHADSLLVKAGSGVATFGVPDSRGVPAALARLTLSVSFNDIEAVRSLFRARGREIAAVIVEPIAGNMGVVPPASGFLETLRMITQEHGALLIFDEVITGFRIGYGGAQHKYSVRPDLTCLGKIIGGGLPIGAYGGARALMEHIAPLGGVYQAGTLSGNPLAVAAGRAALAALAAPGVYDRLETFGARLEQGLRDAATAMRLPLTVNRVGSMLTAFFCAGPVTNYAEARRADTARYARFFHAMLERGVYLAPSQFEAAFLSLAHSEDDLARTAAAARDAMATVT